MESTEAIESTNKETTDVKETKQSQSDESDSESDSDSVSSKDSKKSESATKDVGKVNEKEENKTEQVKSSRHRSRSRSRSRSRDAHRRRSRGHRKSRHSRRRSRSHSRSRRRRRSRSHSRSRRRRRHPSSSRHRRRRSRSRQRRRRSRSADRERKSSGLVVGFSRRSRSRSRDGPRSNFHRKRSPIPPRNNDSFHGNFSNSEKKSYKELMKEQFMQAGQLLGATQLMTKQGGMDPAESSKPISPSAAISDQATLNLLPNMSEEELSRLATKNPQVARVLLMRSRAEALTGVTVPKYYSLSAVNPLKYAEQMQKRKMLWSSSKDSQQKNEALWTASSAAVAGTGEEASRFRKLMGIKEKEEDAPAVVPTKTTASRETASVVKKQEELFRNLDKEYEQARVVTHSARGVGLGYSSQSYIDPNQFQR